MPDSKRIKWDVDSARKYEIGVDQGVLFVANASGTFQGVVGVPWNGLTSVTESPEGAEPTDIYADNIKYLTLMSAETFKCSIEAYTYPDEFEACDGSKALVTGGGVYASQQERKVFAFSYRTKVATALNPEAGYKIHIVYNCLASPSERAHETINDSPDAQTMSWEISSTPVAVTGYKGISHIVIDSTKVDATKLASFENLLYGDEAGSNDATLQMPEDVISHFSTL